MSKVLLMWDVHNVTQLSDGSYCVQGMYRGQVTRNFHFGYGMTEEAAIKDMKSRFENAAGDMDYEGRVDIMNKIIKDAHKNDK